MAKIIAYSLFTAGVIGILGFSLPHLTRAPIVQRPNHETNGSPEIEKENQFVVAIKRLGGEVYRKNDRHNAPVTEINLYGTKACDKDLESLQVFSKLETLDLRLTKVTDAGLVHIK